MGIIIKNIINKIPAIIYLIIIVFFGACDKRLDMSSPEVLQKIAEESKRVNAYFDRMFDEYVDRHPQYQTYLGIKKDYDKWDDNSENAEKLELKKAKQSLRWLKDSVDFRYLNDQTSLSLRLYKKKLGHQINDYKYRLDKFA